MKKSIISTIIRLYIFILILFQNINLFSQNTELDLGVKNICDQILNNYYSYPNNKKNIAVLYFADKDNNKVNRLEKYFSDVLLNTLELTEKYNVINRTILNKIVNDHNLKLEGSIDPDNAKKLAEIEPIHAILHGTILKLRDKIRIEPKLIEPRNSNIIFPLSPVTIRKDDFIKELLGEYPYNMNEAERNVKSSGKIFFDEDFRNHKVGSVSLNWIGAENAVIERSNYRKYLTTYERGIFKLMVPNINFTDNFKIEWVASFSGKYSYKPDFRIVVGNIGAGASLDNYNDYIAFLGNLKEKIEPLNNVPITITLEKKGTVIDLYFDSTLIITNKYYSFKPSSFIYFEFGSRDSIDNSNYQTWVKIYRITCIDLGTY